MFCFSYCERILVCLYQFSWFQSNSLAEGFQISWIIWFLVLLPICFINKFIDSMNHGIHKFDSQRMILTSVVFYCHSYFMSGFNIVFFWEVFLFLYFNETSYNNVLTCIYCIWDYFFSYLTDIRYFPLKKKIWMFQDKVRTSQKWPFWKGCRWFQLFFNWFSVIIFSNQNHPCVLSMCQQLDLLLA